jgi:hypothetical protein
MWKRMWAPLRQNAVWLIDQSVEQELYKLSIAIGTGGVPVFMPANGISVGPALRDALRPADHPG